MSDLVEGQHDNICAAGTLCCTAMLSVALLLALCAGPPCCLWLCCWHAVLVRRAVCGCAAQPLDPVSPCVIPLQGKGQKKGGRVHGGGQAFAMLHRDSSDALSRSDNSEGKQHGGSVWEARPASGAPQHLLLA